MLALRRLQHVNAGAKFFSRRLLSDIQKSNIERAIQLTKEALVDPNSVVDISALSDRLKRIADEGDATHQTIFDTWKKESATLTLIAEDRIEFIKERSTLMTLQDETRQERNSEVLGIAGFCLFGVFSVAIHPLFLFPFAGACNSLMKQRKRETYRIEAMDRIEEINHTLIQNTNLSREALQQIEEELTAVLAGKVIVRAPKITEEDVPKEQTTPKA